MFWNIVGPLLAVGISILFTILHTKRVHKNAIREAYSEQFLTEVQQWADQIIDLCNQVKDRKFGPDFQSVLTKRHGLIEEGVRLYFIKICGVELPTAINTALDYLTALPDKRIWNDNDVKGLESTILHIKVIASDLRYVK